MPRLSKAIDRDAGSHDAAKPTVCINIRGVPIPTWKRARHNALASGLAFRDYLVLLLNACEALPAKGTDDALESDLATPMQAPVVPTQAGKAHAGS